MKKFILLSTSAVFAFTLTSCDREQRRRDYCSEGPECYAHLCYEKGLKSYCKVLKEHCYSFPEDEFCQQSAPLVHTDK